MRTCLRNIVVLCLAVPLSGCPSVPTPLSQPEALQASGVFVQAASGMTFPDQVDDFRRVAVTRYDKDGLDVSAGYNAVDPRAPVAATVYVYPAPSLVSIGSPAAVIASAREHLCADEFARRKAEIVHAHPDAQLLDQGDVGLPRPSGPFPGKRARYAFDEVFGGAPQRVSSELDVFCYVGEKWAMEYRFTSPQNAASAGKISQFMADLPWTVASGP